MIYINTETLQYPMSEADIKALSPNTSFPNPFVVREPYAPVLNSPQPNYNYLTQYCIETTPKLIGSDWFQQWQILNYSPEQITENEQRARLDNKRQAASLLQQTDWVELPSVSNPAVNPHLVNLNEFLSYREALRAIAVNPPVTVSEWPVEPEEIWSA